MYDLRSASLAPLATQTAQRRNNERRQGEKYTLELLSGEAVYGLLNSQRKQNCFLCLENLLSFSP